MRKKYMYLFGATLLALSGVGFGTSSVNAKSMHHSRVNVARNYQRYFVNAPQSISSHARYVRGTADQGIRVILQNGRKTVAKTYANRKTGRYTLRIPKRYRAGTQLKVMAEKGYEHPYRLIIVKTPVNQKASVRTNRRNNRKVIKKSNQKAKPVAKRRSQKTSVKRNSKKMIHRSRKAQNKKINHKSVRKPRANRVTIQTPNGNWRTNPSKRGYVQKWNLSQKQGLNEKLYRNGRFTKKLVINAPYHVNAKGNTWTISYRGRGQKKTQQMSMHFLTNNHFNVTKQNGRHANLSFLRY